LKLRKPSGGAITPGRRSWPVSTKIFRAEQVTSDPSKPFCAAGRHQTTIDNGLYGGGKFGAMAEVILHRVAQRYELARFGVFPHRHSMRFECLPDLHYVFAKEEETTPGEVPFRSFDIAQGSSGRDSDDGGHC
jgi:hypothetical protein